MTDSDRRALARLVGADLTPRATTDDLQGLLLQVVFALLMIFIIAYFIFVDNQKKERAEEVMALNRQKLVLALEKVSENMRVRYGLNALMTQGTDGRRMFEPDDHVASGRLRLSPAARKAFSSGSAAAAVDYADFSSLTNHWRSEVLESAGLASADISAEECRWLASRIEENVEAVRLDARGVQRALAARLQRQWVERPGELGEISDPGELADVLRTKSLKLVAEEIGAEILP